MVRTLILTMILAFGLTTANAQTKGDWYVGTGDIADRAWTTWSLSPTVGYGVTDNLMVGCSVAQADSTVDVDVNFHARYFSFVGLPYSSSSPILNSLGSTSTTSTSS